MRPTASTVPHDDASGWALLLAKNVKNSRRSKKITQEVLAEKCGIYRTYLSRIETGRCNPTLSVVAALAGALEISVHHLLLPIE